MKKSLPIALGVVLLCCLAASPLLADGLIQVNPTRQAPSVINDRGPSPNTGTNMDHNEYPAFTRDGKLFFWTRQENPNPGTQWLWVSYFKNRDSFDSSSEGSTLPTLQMSTPWEIHLVNHQFLTVGNDPPPLSPAVPMNAEIKAVAVCEENDPNYVFEYSDRWRYRVTLYLAVGQPEGTKAMWRQHRLVITVNKASQEITSIATAPATLTPTQVIPQANQPNGQVANETEPMVTPDGKYLFWASNKWTGQGNMAEYLYNATACSQTTQTPTSYSNLPQSKFAWKDQYSDSSKQTKELTSRTNYHAVLEEASTGRIAFIFEECQGQIQCALDPASPNRDCDCDAENDRFSTTGFEIGAEPTPIANRAGLSGTSLLWQSPRRSTHPAFSGPQNPDGSWLLFFMRGKMIWYTKIKIDPNS